MDQANSAIAENLKSIRTNRNLSLDALSQLTGVSKSMLRQIEIGASNPTISIIWKIANGLKLPFTSLISLPKTSVIIEDFKINPPLHVHEKGFRNHPMIPFSPESMFEVYYIEIDPGTVFSGEPHSKNAVENIFVYMGEIKIFVDEKEYTVGPKQFITFQADRIHTYANHGTELSIAIMQISYRE